MSYYTHLFLRKTTTKKLVRWALGHAEVAEGASPSEASFPFWSCQGLYSLWWSGLHLGWAEVTLIQRKCPTHQQHPHVALWEMLNSNSWWILGLMGTTSLGIGLWTQANTKAFLRHLLLQRRNEQSQKQRHACLGFLCLISHDSLPPSIPYWLVPIHPSVLSSKGPFSDSS